MRWSFRVQEYDIGFGVRVRIMQDGGSREEDVLPVERFDNVDTIEGSWVADEDRRTPAAGWRMRIVGNYSG